MWVCVVLVYMFVSVCLYVCERECVLRSWLDGHGPTWQGGLAVALENVMKCVGISQGKRPRGHLVQAQRSHSWGH